MESKTHFLSEHLSMNKPEVPCCHGREPKIMQTWHIVKHLRLEQIDGSQVTKVLQISLHTSWSLMKRPSFQMMR